jgi:hypothetical protein
MGNSNFCAISGDFKEKTDTLSTVPSTVVYVSMLSVNLTLYPGLRRKAFCPRSDHMSDLLTKVQIGPVEVVTPCKHTCLNCHWLETRKLPEIEGDTTLYLCTDQELCVGSSTEIDFSGLIADMLAGKFTCEGWTPEDPTEGMEEPDGY